MSKNENLTFDKIFRDQLQLVLGRYKGQSLTRDTAMRMYQDICNEVIEIVKACSLPINNDSVNWLAQAYYDGIRLGGGHRLPEDIFTQRPTLKDLPTKDIVTLMAMVRQTGFFVELAEEMRARS